MPNFAPSKLSYSLHLHQLSLQFFRNYATLSLSFSKDINCLFGENGEGKTNVLDAIHFLSLTRGFRSGVDKQAVKEGEAFFFIQGEYVEQGESLSVQCNLLPGKGKKVIVNGEVYAKLSRHIGRIPIVTVLPSDTELINGGGSLRREFLDTFISQYSPDYLEQLIHYKRCLEQRNATLRMMHEQGNFDRSVLEIWTQQLIPHGQAIWAERKKFLAEFEPVFRELFSRIVSEKEQPSLRYESQLKTNETAEWNELFRLAEGKERALQSSSVGVHKDDLLFDINGISAKHYGSQGQQKTYLISLKLAQHQFFQAQTGKPPLLLLDDIFDKLDENRLISIAELIDQRLQGQIFITDTSLERFVHIFRQAHRQVKFWEVCNSQVKAYVLG